MFFSVVFASLGHGTLGLNFFELYFAISLKKFLRSQDIWTWTRYIQVSKLVQTIIEVPYILWPIDALCLIG